MAGIVEVEPRARAGGGGRAGRDQDGAVAAARAAAEDAARGAAERAYRVGRQRAVAAAGGAGVAAGRIAGAACGSVVVRHQRHQCARCAGGGAGAGGGDSETTGRRSRNKQQRGISIPLLVSGRDEAALRAQADRYADWLSRSPDADWSAVLGTAALHRTHFAARASVSARDAAEATAALRALGAGRPHASGVAGRSAARAGWKLAFLFTGQGAQQLGMGRALA